MTPAPINPFDLGRHLIEDHHQGAEFVDQLEAADMREYHEHCHETGQPDHHHADGGSL